MKNIKNMIVVGGLCLSIACSAVFTLSPMTVYAINTIEYETEYMEPIEESDYLVNQNSRNIFTKIAKKAINNKARLVNFAEKVAGKTVAKNVNKFFTPITRALKPLLKWSEIPGQAVYDAIFRAIINAGGSRSVAANVANAVREVLEWTLF
ncbi:hypothetical protein [Catenibacterium sp.]|uniref:hypothetical protein n=1 Tax=Catenibacterium sp. TaxID=2049022 RepID=UPI003999B0B5